MKIIKQTKIGNKEITSFSKMAQLTFCPHTEYITEIKEDGYVQEIFHGLTTKPESKNIEQLALRNHKAIVESYKMN